MSRDIFKKRVEYKPFEYPEVQQFIDAMNKTFWVHSEVNFDADVQDFKTKLKPHEQECIKRNSLAIAQVEVAVKPFWGDIHKTLPKPEFNNLGATFAESECFDKDTQVLTNSGFKYFRDLTEDDLVAQYEISDKSVTFVKPTEYITKPFKGKLHHYLGKTMDLMVTPEHEIIVENPHSHNIRKAKSCEGIWGRNYFTPAAGYKTGDKEFTTLDRLLIAIQADGSLFGTTTTGKGSNRLDFSFSFKKERKIERVISFLEELGIEYKTSKISRGQTRINASLKGFINAADLDKIKTFKYINLEDIDANWGKQFLEELKLWDGSAKNGTKSFIYYNSREEAINKVIEICALSGYRTCKGINRTAEQGLKVTNPQGNPVRKSSKTCWALTITPLDKTCYPRRSEVEYDDYVYCVTVPSGCIIVRRNKGVVVSGNCRHSEAYARLIEVLGLTDEFKKLLEVPVFKKKLELFEKHFGPEIDFVDKLFFFVIVIENSSLFSQFANILAMSRFKGAMKNIANIINWSAVDENCLDLRDTQILTPKGWRMIKDMQVGDEVFGFKEGKIRLERVLKTISKKLGDKKLYDFSNAYSGVTMTEDHDVIYKQNETWKKSPLKDINQSSTKMIPVTGLFESDNQIELTDWDRLRIAAQADGCLRKNKNKTGETYYIGQNNGKNLTFGLKRERKIERMRELLKRLEVDYSESNKCSRGYIQFKLNYDLATNPFPKNFDWVDLGKVNRKYAEEFIEELSHWDVSIAKDAIIYSTNNLSDAEKVQAMGILAGYITKLAPNQKKGYAPTYRVNLCSKDIGEVILRSHTKKLIEGASPDLEVGCVTVPSGGIIVKRGYGRPMITGNCHANAGIFLLNQIFLEHPEMKKSQEAVEEIIKDYIAYESELLDWIFEEGEFEWYTKEDVVNFMKFRVDTALSQMGYNKIYNITAEQYSKMKWFDEEVFSGESDDFFAKRPTAYTKHDKPFDAESLF